MFWKTKCFSDGIDQEEARNLQKIYEACLQRAEDLELFNDGQSQGLVQALIESELRADIQVTDDEDTITASSTLQTDDDEGAEEAGKLPVWLCSVLLCCFHHFCQL